MLNKILFVILIGLIIYYFNIIFQFRKEKDMAVVYATLIIKGLKTIDDVPVRLKKQVEEILEALEI